MRRPQKRDALVGYAVAAVVGIIALLVATLFGMSRAEAGGVRRSVCIQAVHQPAYAVQQVAVPYPIAAYRTGQYLQQEATDTYQFRQSEEYIELQQLRGFKAGVESVTSSADRPSGPPQPASLPGHPAATEGDLLPEPPAPPVEASPEPTGNLRWDAFKLRFPVTAAKCASCHGQKNPDAPEGDLFLNGDMTLDGPDGELRRFKMLAKVYNGHMPPKNPMDDATYSAFQAELLAEIE